MRLSHQLDLFATQDVAAAIATAGPAAPAPMAEPGQPTVAPATDVNDNGPAQAAPSDWVEQPDIAFRRWKLSQRIRHKEFNDHSVEQYGTMFGAFLRWLAERGMTLTTARSEHLDLFLASKAGRDGKPAAPTTRRRYLRLINSVYEHLRLLELRKDNPAAPLVDLTRHQDFEKPAPTLLPFSLAERYGEWSLIHTGAGHWVDERNRALRVIFLASGITVKEAQLLSPADVLADEDGTVQLSVPAHGFVLARVAPMAEFARDAVLTWSRKLREIAPNCPRLFPARNFGFAIDKPEDFAVSSTEIFLIVQEAMTAIGYERQRQGPQTLRNTFIARQIYEGRPTERIMAWTGLNSPETVNRIAKLVPLREGEPGPA